MENPKVSMVISTYLYGSDEKQRRKLLRCLLYSIVAQTYENWEGMVVHNGPDDSGRCRALVYDVSNKLEVLLPPENRGLWGNPWRRWGAEQTTGDCVVMANDDGYYMPTYMERMVGLIQQGHDFAYCDMVYGCWKPGSNNPYHLLPTAPRTGYIGTSPVMVTRALSDRTPWKDDFEYAGEARYIERLAANAKRIGKVEQILYVEN